ncbi:hypothetical protein F8388_015887 [Cannabis sativa]|uniref:Chaperone DnaJ C-terminal domain-containing protein n=1 Tax=Cannabis sativa TaxID=3483 RepID=A0A7J6FVW6_CANSA|nr:hypothetical protein F8388_015887 [Cannabis sativa]
MHKWVQCTGRCTLNSLQTAFYYFPSRGRLPCFGSCRLPKILYLLEMGQMFMWTPISALHRKYIQSTVRYSFGVIMSKVPRLRCSGHFTANMTLLAILGGKVEVPTLSGKTQLFTYSSLLIPMGVQHGHLLILRGKGLPKPGLLINHHGDQYVRFSIKFPT